MYFILATLVLLAAYAALLAFEAWRGARVFAAWRVRLDRAAERGLFIVSHVDFASFARVETHRAALYVAQQAARMALYGVRAAEGLLVRLVRRLRLHPEAPAPGGQSARHFVRTLSEFKGQLETSRPPVPEVR